MEIKFWGFIEIIIIELPKIQLRTQEQFSVFNEILRFKKRIFGDFGYFITYRKIWNIAIY